MISTLALGLALQTSAVMDPQLDDAARRAHRFFWERTHPVTGFTKDRSYNFGPDRADNVVSSVAATGFALAAFAIGAERGWQPRDASRQRALTSLKGTFEKAPTYKGWYFHFFNWETGERMWQSELSSIDTSIFLAGATVAERYFKDPEITAWYRKILDRVDWKFMMTNDNAIPDAKLFSHGWRPENGWIPARWASYSEETMLYLQGYGHWKEMPEGSWAAINRPEVEYQGLKFLTGGPLFIHHMTFGFYDFKEKRCPLGFDYWVSSRNANLANRLYCIENPKKFKGYSEEMWGLTATDKPDGYEAFGAPGWTNDHGVLGPLGAIATVMYMPTEALQALRGFHKHWAKGYGQYGFVISFSPEKNWQSPDVIGIDLGMMLVAIENHRDGFVHRQTNQAEYVQRGFERIGFRKTDEGPIEKRTLRRAP